ncbi:deoxyribodipyrimidine photo-lyase [Isoalcanivorax indicus]|uniref:deoxyribodipyrimidine photo-lyase n=1 Tax=Isoalcanivorax indicus TaxID=2202653 RepID=UPI000DBA03E2|nr:deoxyribodipyrimidine photo-lyase [Isoalcanivorax indicus]
MTTLVWYRNDLRVQDHQALSAALASGEPVRALYLLCPAQWDAHDVAPLRRWYVLASLRELGSSLGRLGIPLDILDCGDFAAVPRTLADYCGRHAVRTLFSTREYPLNERRRDHAVVDALRPLGVDLKGFDDAVLVPPRSLRTGQGTPYTVFTPYRRRWDALLAEQPPTLPLTPGPTRSTRAVSFESRVLDKALTTLSLPASMTQGWQAGEKAALAQLKAFVDGPLPHYKRDRDMPALPGTSLLSTALSAGTLSVARCFIEADARRSAGREGVATWISELAWRDFYRQIMANFPHLARGEPFRPETGFVQWSGNDEHFQAWCEGRTGYPLVDAAMRQLNSTGWMHNRLRMVSAMFLTKNLFIDWRLGERYFMQTLIDGDLAANNGGWQWSASTGTDAAPYFRVFSPVRQSERFDPEGHFIRSQIPELAHLDGKSIHQPWRSPMLAPDYPTPVVALDGVRERVTAAFQAARDIYDNTHDTDHHRKGETR